MNESTASDAGATAAASATKPLGDVIAINEGLMEDHLGKIVVTTVETLNALVDAEADQLCAGSATSIRRSGSTPAPVITSGNCTRKRAK